MVVQRMGTQGSGSDFGQPAALIINQDPESNQLASQGSLYNLTLDEVQNQLAEIGKPLSSMNLDELLKSVFIDCVPASASSFNQSLTGDLSKKTVDQVWRDIQQGEKGSGRLERKTALGDMTLEDFLVKAGAVAESRKNLAQETQWMNYPIPLMNSQQQQNVVLGFVPGGVPAETPMMMPSSPMMGGALSDTQTPSRKRVVRDGVAEESVERRQKRMIKNRESAARSRARKQAYTHELENKVSCLEEENYRLKRRKELETALSAIPVVEPKYQLRRASSAPV